MQQTQRRPIREGSTNTTYTRNTSAPPNNSLHQRKPKTIQGRNLFLDQNTLSIRQKLQPKATNVQAHASSRTPNARRLFYTLQLVRSPGVQERSTAALRPRLTHTAHRFTQSEEKLFKPEQHTKVTPEINSLTSKTSSCCHNLLMSSRTPKRTLKVVYWSKMILWNVSGQ